jgi:hypothetical protein
MAGLAPGCPDEGVWVYVGVGPLFEETSHIPATVRVGVWSLAGVGRADAARARGAEVRPAQERLQHTPHRR